MILHVTYETKDGVINKTFKHKFPAVLLECARKHELYDKSHTVTYELEDEYGDKYRKR